MPDTTFTHSDYLDSFTQFMKTGENEPLATYLEGARPIGFLNVYRNGYLKASVSGLESNFPALVKFWGEDYFRQVANAYVDYAPPNSATLVGYGFEATHDEPNPSFFEFMQTQLPEVVAQFPYVIDICRLEQAWLQVLNESSEGVLTLETVQDLIARGEDLAELPLQLVDSSRVIELDYDILPLWSQLRFGEVTEGQQIEVQTNTVIFWQRDLQVQAKQLMEAEAVFMKSLKQNESFDAATSKALDMDENFDVSTLFAELLNAQLLKLEN